jgi:hypothetical protein
MFERFVGPDRFRDVIRSYLRDHTGAAVSSNDFVAGLGAATSPAVATAFSSFLERAGAPVVELVVRCGGSPALELHARGGATVPVCVRHPGGRACTVVGDHARIALATCPGWIVGNAGGEGYYRIAAPIAGARPPLSPAERLAHADDIAGAVLRNELAVRDAIAELETLAAARDPVSQLAALAIAEVIDPAVDDATRPAWSRWLAARFAPRLGKLAMLAPRSAVELELRDHLARAIPAERFDPAVLAGATAVVDAALRGGLPPPEFALALAAPRGGRGLFDRLVAAAAAAGDDHQDTWLEDLGAFGPELAPRLVDLLDDPRFRPSQVWSGIAALLARTGTRGAAWDAVRDRLPKLFAQLGDDLAPVIDATGSLCDPAARAQVAAAFAPKLDPAHPVLATALAHALATIDRCITQRVSLGELAAALR